MNVLKILLYVWCTSLLVVCAAFAKDPADQLKSMPHVKVQYYELESKNFPELRKEMNLKGPVDFLKRPRDAFTYWEIKWSWPFNKAGKPIFSKTTSEYKITVTIPRWHPPKDMAPEYLAQWNKFYEAIVLHEKGHVENVQKNYPRVVTVIREEAAKNPEMKTQDAHRLAESVLDEIKAFDAKYDQETRNGHTQGVVFP